MAPHHEPFKALGPIDWESVPVDSLDDFLGDTFANAQTVIDSIPVPAPIQAAAAGNSGSSRRARSHTDPPLPSAAVNRSLSARQSGSAIKHSQDLMKEWKEVKVNPRENPLAINVYKLAAKDGRGSWFARRSVHDGMTFDKWRLGLQREFAESMKVQSGPGGGSIRGIGADRRVEHHVVEGAGKTEVFQLSAQFPGPTAPRDFITLFLSSDDEHESPKKGEQRPLRSFMILSKPCEHPECPQRQGYIRGQYESVEIIREVPSDKPTTMRRARSSIDVGSEDPQKRQSIAEEVGKEAVVRAAKQVAENNDNRSRAKSVDSAPAREETDRAADGNLDEEDEDVTTTIEWLMITRSDPGGNVPRFMIERGTPGGIVSDAGKFLKWLTAKSAKDFEPKSEEDEKDGSLEAAKTSAVAAEETKARTKSLAPAPTSNLVPDDDATTPGANKRIPDDDEISLPGEQVPSSNGLYGIISGAFGMASSAVSGLPGFFSGNNSSAETIAEEGQKRLKDEDDLSDDSDSSSIRSFTSAQEGNGEGGDVDTSSTSNVNTKREEDASISGETQSQISKSQNNSNTQFERDMKKLQNRRQKALDKMSRLQSRMESKRADESQKDAANLAKLREKHERETAKQEQKYRKEVERLERKRESDEKKAEEKKRKQAEREEKVTLGAELDKTRAERDLALKQVEMLKAQVGELQGQNTMLVREIGRMGAERKTGEGEDKGDESVESQREDSVSSEAKENQRPAHKKRNSVSDLLKRADSTLSRNSTTSRRGSPPEAGKVAAGASA